MPPEPPAFSSAPSTVVFDLGGVLIDWNPRHLYRQLFDDEAEMEWFLENVTTSEWNRMQDAGRPFADGVRLLVDRHPEHEMLIRAFHERWEEMLGGPIHGSVDVLRELRDRDVPLFALTNWSTETFGHARERYDFLGWFDGIVVSGEERVAKPDAALYEVLVSRHGITPAESVFIDDVPENVEAARALGFAGIRFVSPARLRKRLVELELLPRESAKDEVRSAKGRQP